MKLALLFDERYVRAVSVGRKRGHWIVSHQAAVEIGSEGLAAAIGEALRTVGVDAFTRSVEVVVVLPREKGMERIVEAPALRREALTGLVAHELERGLPWPLDEVLFGYSIMSRARGRVRLLVAAVRRDYAEEVLSSVRNAGAIPTGVTFSDLALLGLDLPEVSEGVILCAATGDGAELICMSDDEFRFSRHVSGGEESTLRDEVSRTIAFARDTLNLAIGRIAAAKTIDDNSFSGESIGVAAFETWCPSGTASVSPEFWPAVGAAIGLTRRRKLGRRGFPVPNLLEETRNGLGWPTVAIAGLLILALASVGLLNYARILRGQVADLHARVERLEGPRAEAAAIAREIKVLEAEITGWGRGQEIVTERLTALEDIAGLIPQGTTVTGIDITKDRLVDLSGEGTSALAVMESLQQSKSLHEVSLTGPVRRGKAGEEFHVGGRLR